MAAERDFVGLLAGTGTFPDRVGAAIKAQGKGLVCAQLAGQSTGLASLADDYQQWPLVTVSDIVQTLQTRGVREVVVAGTFRRVDLLAASNDPVMAAFLSDDDRRDASMLQRVAAALQMLGMVMVDQARYVGDLLVPPGVLTARAPTRDETADIAFGTPIARHIADLDVGQTVVVRGGVMLAVEAAEGTDATIRRGGAMTPGVVVVKVSRRKQDPRFDIPTIGPETITAMREVGARALGIDGRRTFVLDRDRLVAAADAAGITITAAETPPLGTPVDAGA